MRCIKRTFRLLKNRELFLWRKIYSPDNKFFETYVDGNTVVQFELKYNVRRKTIKINELIIGDIRTNTTDFYSIEKAFRQLLNKINRLPFVSIISVAVNPQSKFNLTKVLNRMNFFSINKHIYFAIKNFTENTSIENPKNWILYRSDIDTW